MVVRINLELFSKLFDQSITEQVFNKPFGFEKNSCAIFKHFIYVKYLGIFWDTVELFLLCDKKIA